MKLAIVVFSLLVVLFACTETSASMVWDYSPATYGTSIPNWGNASYGQNFAEKVVFAQDVQVQGMDMYSDPRWGAIGDLVVIRLWSDASGVPGTLLSDFTVPISVIDSDGADTWTQRKHADFATPLVLSASTTYWIGMSGASKDVAQGSLARIPAGGDFRMAWFDGAAYERTGGTGDMAFRLEGDFVPEPSTLVLLFGALGVTVGWRRRYALRRSGK